MTAVGVLRMLTKQSAHLMRMICRRVLINMFQTVRLPLIILMKMVVKLVGTSKNVHGMRIGKTIPTTGIAENTIVNGKNRDKIRQSAASTTFSPVLVDMIYRETNIMDQIARTAGISKNAVTTAVFKARTRAPPITMDPTSTAG